MPFYHSLKDVLPSNIHIKEVIENLGVDSDNLKFVPSSTVYEDNNGAIVVATSQSMDTKSNHISVK